MHKISGSTPPPLVSIVILFLAASPWIARCLDAVRRSVPASIPYEVIVLANGVAGEVSAGVEPFSHMRWLSTRVNLGFGGGCNWASRHARGEFLVFLNDDTEVEDGWLQALLRAAAAHEDAAAVGSRVIGADGRIEEAGRVLWSDGVTSGIASGRPASQPLSSMYEVDHCSACSLLVRRTAWDAVGGFDERYFPAYYEDTDLSLQFHGRGWTVVCATGSRVRHRRSVSTSAMWRRFLGVRNHGIFVEKWAAVLPQFEPRPRDRPTAAQVERVARGAGHRHRAAYHGRDMSEDAAASPDGRLQDSRAGTSRLDGDAEGRIALLEEELAHLLLELRLKDEYIAHLKANAPGMERALLHLLEHERQRVRRREIVRAIPFLGSAAGMINRRVRSRSSGTGDPSREPRAR